MATTIDTTTQTGAPGQSNQRKLVATFGDTILVAAVNSLADSRWEFWVSVNSGASYTESTALRISYSGYADSTGSLFMDLDGNMHFAWGLGSGGAEPGSVKYAFAKQATSPTWTSPLTISAANSDAPDVVAHRTGTGWTAHVVCSVLITGVSLARVSVTSGGVPSLAASDSSFLPGNIDTASISFAHIGDGVTASASPHLFLVGGSSAGPTAVYYRKAVYSAGAWTGSTVRTIDTTRSALGLCSSAFDGSRTVIAWSPSSDTTSIKVAERDAADTTTTLRTPTALSDGALTGLSVTTDSIGDIHLVAVGTTSDDPKRCSYSRSGGTWSAWTTIEATTCAADSVTTRRAIGYYLDTLYATGASSPFTIKHDRVTLNSMPNGAPWATADGAYDVASTLVLDWVFSDPNPSDTQLSYVLKRDIGGTIRYYRASDQTWQTTEQTNTTATTTVTLAAAWGLDADATHLYYIKTTDAGSLTGPFGPALTVTPSAKVEPTLDEPDPADVVASSMGTLEWTVAQQSAYRAVITDTATSAIVADSGVVADTATRSWTSPAVLLDGGSYTASITTRNTEGLDSTPDTAAFTVTYTPPPDPIVTTDDSSDIYIDVTWENPIPIGDQPEVTSVDLYVKVQAGGRVDGDRPVGGTGVRIATGLEPNSTYRDYAAASDVIYLYRVVAVAANGTTSTSGWSDDTVSDLVSEEV